MRRSADKKISQLVQSPCLPSKNGTSTKGTRRTAKTRYLVLHNSQNTGPKARGVFGEQRRVSIFSSVSAGEQFWQRSQKSITSTLLKGFL